jgi:hypothetical protein
VLTINPPPQQKHNRELLLAAERNENQLRSLHAKEEDMRRWESRVRA